MCSKNTAKILKIKFQHLTSLNNELFTDHLS
jgi:hypothetical protein